MSVTFDASEFRKLAVDLGAAGDKVGREVDAVLARGALNIKRQLQSEAQGHAHAPGLPAAITYESHVGAAGAIEYEIGPRTGGAGSLAFYYFGNSRVGPSLPDPMLALEREAPTVERFVGDALEGLL